LAVGVPDMRRDFRNSYARARTKVWTEPSLHKNISVLLGALRMGIKALLASHE
jgi:hypothetical protein